MKAALVTLASLAGSAFTLSSAGPGREGFQVVRRAGLWDDFCAKAFSDADDQCKKERNGGQGSECYNAGQDASMGCLVDHSISPGTREDVHQQCRTEAVEGARACYDAGKGKSWGVCYEEQLKAYPDCANKGSTASGQGSVSREPDQEPSRGEREAERKELAKC